MNPQSETSPASLFARWRAEDSDLNDYVDQLRQWMNEVNQIGIPHFGEAGDRLNALRKRLLQHFNREDEIIAALATSFGGSVAAVEALRVRADADHSQMLKRVDSLSDRLNQIDPPFPSWTAAMREIESFVDELDRHEKEESDQIAATLSDSISDN